MATWTRIVELGSNGDPYVLPLPPPQDQNHGGTNPPPIAGKGARTDDANNITVYAEDRGASGARIIYNGNGVSLTGLRAKDGSALPSYTVNGGNLTITDTGAEGTSYEYHVVAGSKETADPQIHNGGE
ncbi:MAG: hypothetical protein OEN56_10130 [Gemmatimonadota bacterium]|nr:hypothetical protein [Gemmatimonadota bacterium]MDH3424567.1 hypothetical protein [Gemmatimonadota bacterium]